MLARNPVTVISHGQGDLQKIGDPEIHALFESAADVLTQQVSMSSRAGIRRPTRKRRHGLPIRPRRNPKCQNL